MDEMMLDPELAPLVLRMLFNDLAVVSEIKEGKAIQQSFDVETELKIDLSKLKGLAIKAVRNSTRQAKALNGVLTIKAISVTPVGKRT